MFQEFATLASSFGFTGVAVSAVIFLLILILRASGVVATGNHARIANLALSVILSGLSEDPAQQTALMAALMSVLSALMYEFVRYIGQYIQIQAGSPPTFLSRS